MVGGGVAGQRRVIFQHAVVVVVGHVQVPGRVQRHGHGKLQAVGADAAGVAGGRDEVGLAEDAVGGGVVGQRRVVFQHAVVVGVGHVQVALRVQRHAMRVVQAVGAGGVALVVVVVGEVGLAEDAVGGSRRGQRRVVLQHAVVVIVGHVHVSLGIHRHAGRSCQAVLVQPALVDGAGGEAADLTEHEIGRRVQVRGGGARRRSQCRWHRPRRRQRRQPTPRLMTPTANKRITPRRTVASWPPPYGGRRPTPRGQPIAENWTQFS